MNNFRKHLLLYCKSTFQRTDNQSEISAENQIQQPEKETGLGPRTELCCLYISKLYSQPAKFVTIAIEAFPHTPPAKSTHPNEVPKPKFAFPYPLLPIYSRLCYRLTPGFATALLPLYYRLTPGFCYRLTPSLLPPYSLFITALLPLY
jgi:hypothetical protein